MTNTIQLIFIIPLLNNNCYYYLNEAEQKHFTNVDNIKKIIKNIDSSYFLKIEFYLERKIPFYINFINKEINKLDYINDQPILSIEKNIQKYIHLNNEQQKLYKDTEKINKLCNKINKKYTSN